MKEEYGSIEAVRQALDGMTIHVIAYTHPDWSWCHTRQWHELRYIAVFEELLRLIQSGSGVKWYMDCYATQMAPVVERRPDLIPEIRRAVEDGRIAVCGGFSNIRPNMAADETIIRNLVIGRGKFAALFPEANLSVHADAVDVSCGHPQMPQLLAKSGYRFYRAGRPYGVFAKKGIPSAFVWEGLDASRVLCWWAEYGALASGRAADLLKNEANWETAVTRVYDSDIKIFTEHSPVDIAWLPQGGDDCLPLKTLDANAEVFLDDFIRRWNRRETSAMRFSTPPEFFEELNKRIDRIPLFRGSPDPCDVCYNVAWGGERGLAPLRLRAGESIAAAEKWMSWATLAGCGKFQDTQSLWEDLLKASAHASQWVFREDEAEIRGYAQRALADADNMAAQARRSIAENAAFPAGAAAVVFNGADKPLAATVELTLPRGEADSFYLTDGEGLPLAYQVLEPYEYDGFEWECRLLAQLSLPPNGMNCISVPPKALACSRPAPYARPLKPSSFETAIPFSINNSILKLDFHHGELTAVTDLQAGCVMKGGLVNWNTLEFVGIDTAKGSLHAGPETGRSPVRWQRWEITKNGPVRYEVKLTGKNAVADFEQRIRLDAGSKTVVFETSTPAWPVCEGYLSAAIPLEPGAKLEGGIPFGVEIKDILSEPYEGREEGWNDFHRQWDGLFFAKDFAAAKNGAYTAALCHLSGDRYYRYEGKTQSLACILLNCALPYKDTCEEYMNPAMFQSPGPHHFTHAVLFAGPDEKDESFVSAAAALRLPQAVMRPYRKAGMACAIPPKCSFAAVDAENVMLSAAFFKGEDFFIRIWESAGRRTAGCLALPRPAACAAAEDFLGCPDHTASAFAENGVIRFEIRPFEIMTLRVEFA